MSPFTYFLMYTNQASQKEGTIVHFPVLRHLWQAHVFQIWNNAINNQNNDKTE